MRARTSSLVTGFAVVLARLATCQTVLPYNSTLFHYSSTFFPNIRGGCNPPGYYDCAVDHVLPRPGCTVQLEISAVSFQASFLKDVDGMTAIIYVDGQVASQTPTNDSSTIAWQNCEITVSDVIPLSDGLHNVTVAADISPENNSSVSLYFIGLSYQSTNMSSSSVTSASSLPLLPPSSQPPSSQTGSKNEPVGAIVGGVIGGLALIAVAAILFQLVLRNGRKTPSSESEPPPGTVSPFMPRHTKPSPSPSGNPNGSKASRQMKTRSAVPFLAVPSTSPAGNQNPQAATTSRPQFVPDTTANVTPHPNAEEVEITPQLPPYQP